MALRQNWKIKSGSVAAKLNGSPTNDDTTASAAADGMTNLVKAEKIKNDYN